MADQCAALRVDATEHDDQVAKGDRRAPPNVEVFDG
jgi:hypothetical protein